MLRDSQIYGTENLKMGITFILLRKIMRFSQLKENGGLNFCCDVCCGGEVKCSGYLMAMMGIVAGG
jgi:hypothetical protein